MVGRLEFFLFGNHKNYAKYQGELNWAQYIRGGVNWAKKSIRSFQWGYGIKLSGLQVYAYWHRPHWIHHLQHHPRHLKIDKVALKLKLLSAANVPGASF